MLKLRSSIPYWTEFAKYSTFSTKEELHNTVASYISTYMMTKTMQKVFQVLSNHSQRLYLGVCWLKQDEIARKAKVGLSSVQRALKAFAETGLIQIHPFKHTELGRNTHNVYVIMPVVSVESTDLNFEVSEYSTLILNEGESKVEEIESNLRNFTETESTNEVPNNVTPEPEQAQAGQDSKPVLEDTYSLNTLEEKDLKDLKDFIDRENDSNQPNRLNRNLSESQNLDTPNRGNGNLNSIPNEFKSYMSQFYQPSQIQSLWKSTCVCFKRSLAKYRPEQMELIKSSHRIVLNRSKRGLVKDLAGYFFKTLQNELGQEPLFVGGAF